MTFLRSQDVKNASKALDKVDEAAFRSMFRFEEMAENGIYPPYPDEDSGELFDYAWSNSSEMKLFFGRAASENKALLFHIS